MTNTATPAGTPAAAAPQLDANGQPVVAAPAAAAPTVPAVPATPGAVEKPVETANGDGTFTIAPTGDVALDLSLEFFGRMGISLDSPEMVEAEKGNFAYLEAKLGALGDKAKGWERYVALGKEAHTRITKAEADGYAAREKVVHDTVGGKENWDQISKWAQENGTPEEVAEIKSAMKLGGKVAQAMATFLQQTYMAAGGTTKDAANPTTNQPAVPASSSAPLTLAGYQKEVMELQKRVGSTRMDTHPEYHALRQKYAGVSR